jgi:hypothetical protein
MTPRPPFDRRSTAQTMSAACPMSARSLLKPVLAKSTLTDCCVAGYVSDNLRTSATRFEENRPIPCPHSSRFKSPRNARNSLPSQ